MGSPLKNPPVFFTLLQVKFNTILKLKEFLPGIQESMRKAGLSDFIAQQVFTLEIVNDGGKPKPNPVLTEQYMFGNLEKTHLFILTRNALALQSTDYGRFETFSEMFIKGLSRVNAEVTLDFTERIGLRYLDRVMPNANDDLEHYLAPAVMGMSKHFKGEPVHSYSETVSDYKNVRLISRVSIKNGPLTFPPDLELGTMAVMKQFTEYNGMNAILDNDGFVEMREAYSEQTIAKHVGDIHDVIGAAFKATATPYAFDIWK